MRGQDLWLRKEGYFGEMTMFIAAVRGGGAVDFAASELPMRFPNLGAAKFGIAGKKWSGRPAFAEAPARQAESRTRDFPLRRGCGG